MRSNFLASPPRDLARVGASHIVLASAAWPVAVLRFDFMSIAHPLRRAAWNYTAGLHSHQCGGSEVRIIELVTDILLRVPSNGKI
jgi:hypothetical protein